MWILIVVSLIVLIVLLVILIPYIKSNSVYVANKITYQTPEDFETAYETLELKSFDGTKLVSWIVPCSNESEQRPWLIYFHGSASNISFNLGYTLRLAEEFKVNLLLAEYRGFFECGGKPSERGILQDARSYYDYLIDQGVSPENIILYGYSLGSGVATDLASKVDIAALILEAPYTSIPNAAKTIYGRLLPAAFVRNRFSSISKINLIDAPLFIMHGNQDHVIPFEHGQQLFEAALEPKRFREFDGNHMSLPLGGHIELSAEIQEFLEENHVL